MNFIYKRFNEEKTDRVKEWKYILEERYFYNIWIEILFRSFSEFTFRPFQ